MHHLLRICVQNRHCLTIIIFADSKVHILRISWQQQANGGIGWSDDGIDKYNKIYDLIEIDRQQLRGDTFDQELLKVHQKRRQKHKKMTERNGDNERSKKH